MAQRIVQQVHGLIQKFFEKWMEIRRETLKTKRVIFSHPLQRIFRTRSFIKGKRTHIEIQNFECLGVHTSYREIFFLTENILV